MISEFRVRRLRQLYERLLDQARFRQQRAVAALDGERAMLISLSEEAVTMEGDDLSGSATIADFAQRRAHAARLWERIDRQKQVVAEREEDLEQQRSRTLLVYRELAGWETLERSVGLNARRQAERMDVREGDDAAIVRYARTVREDRSGATARRFVHVVAGRRP